MTIVAYLLQKIPKKMNSKRLNQSISNLHQIIKADLHIIQIHTIKKLPPGDSAG